VVYLNTRDLSNPDMLLMMASENLEDWGTSAGVELGVMRAVVEGFADGRLDLDRPSERANKSALRYAPSFIPGDASRASGTDEKVYTAQTIGRFLGWVKPSGHAQDKVATLLTILQYDEEGYCQEADFDRLSIANATANIEQVRATREDAERRAQNAAKEAEHQKSKIAFALEKQKSATHRFETQTRKIKEAEDAGDSKARNSRRATRRRQRVTRGKPRSPLGSRASGTLLRPKSSKSNLLKHERLPAPWRGKSATRCDAGRSLLARRKPLLAS
jgi:hypothetical protein